MRFKLVFLIFIFSLQSYPWASEVIMHSVDPAQKPVATQADVKSLRGLIKKEFSVQSTVLKNEMEELVQLKIQTNALDKSLNAVESQQSIVLNNLRFIEGLLSVLFILHILWMWFARRVVKAKIDPPTNAGTASNSAIEVDEGGSPPPFDATSVSNIIPATADNSLETKVNLDPLIIGKVSVTSIKIEKATPTFEETPIQRHEMQSNDSSDAISVLLAKVRTIKLDGLEKLNNPRPHTNLAPINLTMRPSTNLGSRRPFKSIVIRNKLLSTRVKNLP